MPEIIYSSLGIRMTERTVTLIRETYESTGLVLSYVIARLADGSLQASLGGDQEVQANAIQDEISGITFYWYAEPELLDEARSFLFDKPNDGPTRLSLSQ